MEAKKKRSENWLEEDKIILKDLLKERVRVIENKNTDSNTNSKKVAAWSDLHDSFNNMARTPRTLKQLKSQWCHIKITEKKAKFEERKQRMKTGGGPPPVSNPTNFNDIAVWLPSEFETDSNQFDSDSQVIMIKQQSQVEINDQVEVINDGFDENYSQNERDKQEPNQQNERDMQEPNQQNKRDFEEHNPLNKKDFLEHDPLNEYDNETPEPTTPKKPNKGIKRVFKKKVAANTEKSSIAENEIACRKELHTIQMANERQKSVNLLLKHEILKLTLENMKKKKILLFNCFIYILVKFSFRTEIAYYLLPKFIII